MRELTSAERASRWMPCAALAVVADRSAVLRTLRPYRPRQRYFLLDERDPPGRLPDDNTMSDMIALEQWPDPGELEPADLTDSRLRPRICRQILRCAPSGCSTYCQVRLRARTVARLVFTGISTTSLRASVRSAG